MHHVRKRREKVWKGWSVPRDREAVIHLVDLCLHLSMTCGPDLLLIRIEHLASRIEPGNRNTPLHQWLVIETRNN